eukprot:1150319-Pelagomonas_calceolata.AAC.1
MSEDRNTCGMIMTYRIKGSLGLRTSAFRVGPRKWHCNMIFVLLCSGKRAFLSHKPCGLKPCCMWRPWKALDQKSVALITRVAIDLEAVEGPRSETCGIDCMCCNH